MTVAFIDAYDFVFSLGLISIISRVVVVSVFVCDWNGVELIRLVAVVRSVLRRLALRRLAR